MECIDICPKKAIKVIDSWLEYNAVIDTEQCIQCNACHNACQNNVKQVLTKPIYWKQGWAQDNCIRMRSSSGGVAAAIEREMCIRDSRRPVQGVPADRYSYLYRGPRADQQRDPWSAERLPAWVWHAEEAA